MNNSANQALTLIASPSIAAGESVAGETAAIDIGHLGRMALGDRSLEIQVLELFDRQGELLMARIREVEPAGVALLAHTLTGSARGIGAWRVATAAEALEQAVREGAPLPPAVEALATAVEEARLAICGLLRVSVAA
jgi:hypothetical protein